MKKMLILVLRPSDKSSRLVSVVLLSVYEIPSLPFRKDTANAKS